TSFGKRAFRRPLVAQEVDDLAGLFGALKPSDGSESAVRSVVTRMLQSPHFLYRVELSGEGSDGPASLSAWELASRLSYLLWQTMPDDSLLAAAEKGELTSPAQLAAQIDRLLRDVRARATVRSFHLQWLDVADVDTLEKDAKAYPLFSTLRPFLRTEAETFI